MAKRVQSKSGRRGHRDETIDIEGLKRAIKTSPAREPVGVEASEAAMRRELTALRRSMTKRLEPLITKGIDATKAQSILADYEKKRAQLLKRKQAEVKKAVAAQGKNQAQGIAGRRRALEILATPGVPFTPTPVTLKPFLIWATPSNTILDSHTDPIGPSWAKISLHSEKDGAGSVRPTFDHRGSTTPITTQSSARNARCRSMGPAWRLPTQGFLMAGRVP